MSHLGSEHSDNHYSNSVIHRADYHEVLMNKTKELGVEVVLGAKVERTEFETGKAYLENGIVLKSDVIIGADGMFGAPSVAPFFRLAPVTD
jgi:flavin-dependent dehydrogenase